MVSDAAEASLGPGAVQRIEVETEEEKASKLREQVEDLQEKSRLLQEELKRAAMMKQEEEEPEETTSSPMPQWMGEPLETGHHGWVWSVAISPNDANGRGSAARCIASGSLDGTIRIWNMETGQQVGEPLTGHTDRVWSVAISPYKVDENGGGSAARYIVSGSADNIIRIWNMETGQQVREPLTGHTGGVQSVAISPYKLDENGGGSAARYIVSGSADKTIRIWNMETGQQVGEPLTGHTHGVQSVAISPYKLDENGGGSAARYIVSGSSDKTIRIWNMETGQQVGKPFIGHTATVASVAISPYNVDENGRGSAARYIVSGSSDKTIRIWNMETGQQVGKPLIGHTAVVYSVAISPYKVDENGGGSAARYIVSGSGDSTIRIWNMETGQQVGEPLTGHTAYVFSVAISPDGRYLVSGSADNQIRAWPMPT